MHEELALQEVEVEVEVEGLGEGYEVARGMRDVLDRVRFVCTETCSVGRVGARVG